MSVPARAQAVRRGCGLAAPILLAAVAAACSGAAPTPAPPEAPVATRAPAATTASSATGSTEIILATTTSTQDSGLLDVLVPAFEAATGYHVKPVAVGSGAALQMGADGNADVLLVHAPAAELALMEAGGGVDRRLVMHNTFLIVGPAADPAGIQGMTSAADAFAKIADTGATFVSRGDGSGTEAKELGYWKQLGLTPDPAWYVQSGQGMGATLQVASEKGAYTLTDIATWAVLRRNLALEALVDDDPSLLNIYHVIGVNPANHPSVNAKGAKAFGDYLVSAGGQAIIGAFGRDTFGMQLFVPDAGRSEESLATP